jgi:indole-3-glycerol phosphate synthase
MPLPGILGAIVERTLTDVGERKGRVSRRDLEELAAHRAATRIPFTAALRRDAALPIRFVAEIKKASPSRGVLDPDLDPARLAALYRENGAAAISVVTEPHFFQGEPAFLGRARESAPGLPLLRKDFHVHELQVLETAAGEADALLFIVRALAPTQLRDYLDMAAAFGLEHLVEVGDRREAESALRAGARVVGVNNRDLTTFRVDPERTASVLPVLQEAAVVSVSESGIHDRASVLRFQALGVHALLVGEALVRAEDPGQMLRTLRGVSESGE